MNKIRVSKIASYVPSTISNSVEKGASFGFDVDFLVGKLGTSGLAVKSEGEESSDLCVSAFGKLQLQGVGLDGVKLLVVCTQTPDGHGIPHTSAIVHRKLGLGDECACFDISLGCSGYVYGLSIVAAFMEANRISKGLFFTSDPYSSIVDPDDKATSLLFGDASTVTLLEESGPGLVLVDSAFATQGSGGDAINNRSGCLEMDGRQVFNFAMTAVPKQINSLLDKCGLKSCDVDHFIFHQGSRYIVEKLRDRLGLPSEKVPVHLDQIGNSVSSAIPITLESFLLNAVVSERFVLAGFGVGLSYATAMLEYIE